MAGQDIRIQGPAGEFSAYYTTPKSGRGPGVVVLQEVFGVNAVVRAACEWLAEEGFFAVAPDLFWRLEPDVQLTDKSQAEWKRAFELMQAFDQDAGIEDIKASIDWMRGQVGCNGKVGAVGYCLGGRLAFMTACRTQSDASVGYYGVGLDDLLDEAANIKTPVLLHVAGKDQFVPPEAQAKIHAGLDAHPRVTIHDYPDDDHAFARPEGAHFSADSARSANDRTLAFFRKHLAET